MDCQIIEVFLYEGPEWIRSIICEYNNLGFFTYTSQPGDEYLNPMYKSTYHRFHERCNKNIIGYALRKQRAYIRGYMEAEIADFVYDRLKNDSYIYENLQT